MGSVHSYGSGGGTDVRGSRSRRAMGARIEEELVHNLDHLMASQARIGHSLPSEHDLELNNFRGTSLQKEF